MGIPFEAAACRIRAAAIAAKVDPDDDRDAHDKALRKVVAAATVSRGHPIENIYDVFDRRVERLIPRVKALPAQVKEEQAEVLCRYACISDADSGAIYGDTRPPTHRVIPPGIPQAKHMMGLLNWFGEDFWHDVNNDGLYSEE